MPRAPNLARVRSSCREVAAGDPDAGPPYMQAAPAGAAAGQGRRGHRRRICGRRRCRGAISGHGAGAVYPNQSGILPGAGPGAYRGPMQGTASLTAGRRAYCMRCGNTCRAAAGSPLASAMRRRYGKTRVDVPRVRPGSREPRRRPGAPTRRPTRRGRRPRTYWTGRPPEAHNRAAGPPCTARKAWTTCFAQMRIFRLQTGRICGYWPVRGIRYGAARGMRQDTWRRCGARNTASRLAAGTALRPGARSARPADSPEFLSQSASRRFGHRSACRSGLPAAPTRPCMKRFEAGCRSTPGRLPYVPGPSPVLGAPYRIAPPAAVYRRLAGSAPPAGPGCPHRAKIGPGSRAVSGLYPFLQMAGRCLGARRR